MSAVEWPGLNHRDSRKPLTVGIPTETLAEDRKDNEWRSPQCGSSGTTTGNSGADPPGSTHGFPRTSRRPTSASAGRFHIAEGHPATPHVPHRQRRFCILIWAEYTTVAPGAGTANVPFDVPARRADDTSQSRLGAVLARTPRTGREPSENPFPVLVSLHRVEAAAIICVPNMRSNRKVSAFSNWVQPTGRPGASPDQAVGPGVFPVWHHGG